MNIELPFIILLIAAYLLGSISCAVITCRLFKTADPRKSGSGNPGSTNVLRVGGVMPAIFTLIGDMLKGVIPVAIGLNLELSYTQVALIALSAVLGHLYPVFFKFKGGKGLATTLGVLLPLSFKLSLLLIISWLTAFYLSRTSSVGAIAVACLAPLYTWYLLYPTMGKNVFYIISLISVILLIKHRSNIIRLYKQTEPKTF